MALSGTMRPVLRGLVPVRFHRGIKSKKQNAARVAIGLLFILHSGSATGHVDKNLDDDDDYGERYYMLAIFHIALPPNQISPLTALLTRSSTMR